MATDMDNPSIETVIVDMDAGGETTAAKAPLRSDEGAPILDRADRKGYAFDVIPRKEMMEMPEEEFVAYLVRLKGIAEIIDEVVVGGEMLLATRQADLLKRIAAADEEARKEAEKAEELQREFKAKRDSATRNAKDAEELRQKLAKLGS